MKYFLSFSLFLLVVSIFFLSCAKHKGDIEEDIPAASVNFLSPAQNAVYKGDSVTIQAVGISTEPIHGYDITIKKQNDTSVYFFKYVHEHNDTVYISEKWKSELHTNLEASITLYLDHEGHTSTKKVGFHVQ